MTRGEHVAVFGVLFFATLGAGTWILTLPDGTQFAAGVGWGMVLGAVFRWADTWERTS